MAELDNVHLAKGDVVSRRYEIEEELGSGLLGVTYKARHITSGKFLAIKVLKPSLIAKPRDRARFEERFQQAKSLRNDGLVRYGEVGEHEGLVYFTQEYFPSQSLRQLIDEYLEQKKSFSFQEASQIILKVLRISDFLHGNQVIHRNLKPENVLINTRAAGPGGKQIVRTVKITDVGLGDVVNPTLFAESYVSRAEARYLAPELNAFDHGRGDLDGDQGQPASDIFSIGVMYYELLVGQTPRGTYLSPSQMRGDLPEYVDNIIEVAIGGESEDRYPTAPDMITDIMRVFEGEVFDDEHNSNFRNILIGVGVGAVLAGGLALYLTQDPPDDPMVEWIAQDNQQRDDAAKTVDSEEPPTNGPKEMLYIPTGEFVKGMLRQEMNTPSAGNNQANPALVPVDAFYIDRFEYPNNIGESPIATGYQEAKKLCEEDGKQLCSADQWEKACRGQGSLIYPYGDDYNSETCGDGRSSGYVLNEETLKECVSTYGVRGMSAAAPEWTLTEGSGTDFYVIKGNSNDAVWGSRCAFESSRRASLPVDETDPIHFRCCKPVSN